MLLKKILMSPVLTSGFIHISTTVTDNEYTLEHMV